MLFLLIFKQRGRGNTKYQTKKVYFCTLIIKHIQFVRMKKSILLLLTGVISLQLSLYAQNTISVFDEILFYDGYDSLENLSNIAPVPDDVRRISTSLITTKLTEEQLNLLSGDITMEVIIKAACDNYDRIGNVNLAFVPKDAESYVPNQTARIELGRFITPFMNKNRQPDTVPYMYDVPFLTHIFQDQALRAQYDFWIELDIFGVPYAANTEVAGCAGRSDVFYGTLSFTTTTTSNELETDNVLIPLSFKHRLTNYNAGDTDEVGKTIKSISFTVEDDLQDAQFVLITSNHGANSGGEEYNRRWHYIYLNNEEIQTYLPGRTSCEPFRVYNTQGNGIYGFFPRTDAQWQSFSNWCPGDKIDIRIINLGALQAGDYVFKIEVPDARFVNNDGHFPLSVYFQGKKNGDLSTATNITSLNKKESTIEVFPNPFDNEVNIYFGNDYNDNVSIEMYNTTGQRMTVKHQQKDNNRTSIYANNLNSGMYFLKLIVGNEVHTVKLVRK